MEIKGEPWFSKIGLEYAKRYEELEAGRNNFEKERNKIYDKLEEIVRKETGRKSPIREYSSLHWYIINSLYSEFRKKLAGKKGKYESAFGVSFYSDDSNWPLGFHCYLFFHGSTVIKERATIEKKLYENQINIVKVFGEEGYLYIRTAFLSPPNPDFDFKNFSAEVKKLPSYFHKTDEIISKIYKQAKEGEEDQE